MASWVSVNFRTIGLLGLLGIGLFGQLKGADPVELISNGSFKAQLSGWVANKIYPFDKAGQGHDDSKYVFFGAASNGSTPLTNASGSLYQSISIPAGSRGVSVSFWLRITTEEPTTTAYDTLTALLQDSDGNTLKALGTFSNGDALGFNQWLKKTYSIGNYTGQTVRVSFQGKCDNAKQTVFRIDDVSLSAELPAGDIQLTINDADGKRLSTSEMNAVILFDSSSEQIEDASPPKKNALTFEDIPFGDYYAFVFCWDMLAGETGTFKHDDAPTKKTFRCYSKRRLVIKSLASDHETSVAGVSVEIYSENGQSKDLTKRAEAISDSDGEVSFLAWPTNHSDGRYLIRQSYNGANLRETFVTLKDESGTETKGLSLDIPPGKEPAPPVARIDFSNIAPSVNQSVKFDGSKSAAVSPKTIKKYEWSFDSGPISSTSDKITKSFPILGFHRAILTVEDSAGLRTSVTATLYVGGLTGSPQSNQAAFSNDPVNLASGNYIYSWQGFTIPGRGIPFDFSLFYNSKAFDPENPESSLGPVGQGWTHSYLIHLSAEQAVTDAQGSVIRVVTFGDGHREAFRKEETTWVGESGVFHILSENADGVFELKTKEQIRYRFDQLGRLVSLTDRNGNSLTITRDDAGKIDFITDTVGRMVDFIYGASGLLEKIVDPIQRKIEFVYDDKSDLRSIKDSRGKLTEFTYDELHQLLTGTDPKKRIFVKNEYDSMQRVAVYQEDALKNPTKFDYDFTTHITTVTDPDNNKSFYNHDDRLRVVRITDPLGHSQEFHYDDNDNRTRVVDANANATEYRYDSRGNVITKIDANLKETAIDYNERNDPILRTEPNGRQIKYEYDSAGNPSAVTNPYLTTEPERFRRTFVYDAQGLERSRKNALGHSTTFDYDADANLIKVTDALNYESSTTFDGVGRKLTETDANNRKTAFVWDSADHLKTVTDAADGIVEHFYDDNGNREKTIDQNRHTVVFGYDEKDRLVSVTNHLNQTVRTEYDAFDRKARVFDAKDNKTEFTYDKAGRLETVTDPLTHVTRYTYDAAGNLLTETDADSITTAYGYDKLNRRTSVKDHLGNETFTVFDLVGEVEKTIDADKNETKFTYTAAGLLETVTDAAAGISRFTYDDEGNRLTMTDPRDKSTTYGYDELNRRISEKDPLNRLTEWTLDGVGNVIKVITPRSEEISRAYDALHRLERITPPTGPPIEFTYDALGNRRTMKDALGTTTWTYDELNRVTAVVDPFDQMLGFGYDANGNRDSITYPGGKTAAYEYDAGNRLWSITDWEGRRIEQSYTPAGRLKEIIYPNGIHSAVGYDAAGRLATISHRKGEDAAFASFGYTFTPSGDIKTNSETIPLPERIVGSSSVTYAYDHANQLASANGIAFTHDPAGNITGGPLSPNSSGDDTLAWDYADRLVSASIGDRQSINAYNGLGHRLATTKGVSTTRFVVDGTGPLAQILAETGEDGRIQVYYLYAGGLSARVEADGTTHYYHADRRGNIVALTDEAGMVTDAYAYDPFGVIINQSGKTKNPFRFLGSFGIYDNDDGTLYVRARYYHSDLGRFLSKDALAGSDTTTQSLNRYIYALNNPMRLVDITGFSAKEGTVFSNPLRSSDSLHSYYIDGIVRGTTPYSSIKTLLDVNPTKSVVALVNSIRSVILLSSGIANLDSGVVVTSTGIFVPAGLALIAVGTVEISSSISLKSSANQQWAEARSEDWDDASSRNLLGILPKGTKFDDPNEPTPLEFYMSLPKIYMSKVNQFLLNN